MLLSTTFGNVTNVHLVSQLRACSTAAPITVVTENYNHILVFLRRGGKAIAYPSLIVIIMILLAGQELSLAAAVSITA